MTDENGTSRYGAQVAELLQRVVGRPVEDEENLFESGAVDSLKLINLILELEECFDISIAEQNLNFDNFRSWSTICRAVAQRKDAPAPTDP